MIAPALAIEPARPASLWQRIKRIGPGLVFVLAAVGPQDLVSNAAAGSAYGYILLWTVALIVLARYVMVEASARYVLASGETLMSGYARAGRWTVWVILISIFVKRHLSSLAHVLILGSAVNLLVPLPTRWSTAIWATIFTLLGFALMYWGKYPLIEKISKPLVVVLGGSLALAAIFSQPDWVAVGRGALIPSIPKGYGVYSYILILMALTGAGANSLANLKYATLIHEKGWRDASHLKQQRLDLLFSGLGMYAMYLFIQVAAAATLQGSHGNLKDVEDLLPMFNKALGPVGRVVLGLGLWAKIFTSYLSNNTGYSLLVADIWHNVLRNPAQRAKTAALSDQPAYRWSVVIFCASPMYVLFTTWKPLWLALMSAALQVVLMPLILAVLLWLTNNRRLMREYVNGWVVNLALVLMVVATVYLTYKGSIEAWAMVVKARG